MLTANPTKTSKSSAWIIDTVLIHIFKLCSVRAMVKGGDEIENLQGTTEYYKDTEKNLTYYFGMAKLY